MTIAKPFVLEDEESETAQEYIIEYSQLNDFEKLMEFIQKYNSKTISIIFKDDIDIKKLKILKQLNSNIVVQLDNVNNPIVEELKKEEIGFYFNVACAAKNFLEMKNIVDKGACSIYIADDLCYSLPIVKQYCSESNVEIRLILNRVPITMFRETSSIDPLYFPEDFSILKQYYDIFEFDCYRDGVWQQSEYNVLYKIWFQSGEWLGSLAEINKDVTEDLYYDAFVPGSTTLRTECDLMCCKNRPCQRCYLYKELSEELVAKDVVFSRRR